MCHMLAGIYGGIKELIQYHSANAVHIIDNLKMASEKAGLKKVKS